MKQKYIVKCDDGYDKATGMPKVRELKSFKHEPDAMAFVSAQKNIGMYGQMSLERHDGDGQKYDWNSLTRSWVQKA